MRPNILWICTDQQRWDTIAALGNAHIRTPNIDRLVQEGTAFDQHFLPEPDLHAQPRQLPDRALSLQKLNLPNPCTAPATATPSGAKALR